MSADDWEERALLGERLARRLDAVPVRERLLQLLLDNRNTAVTYRTALALLDRRDRLGLELIVTASTQADDDTNQWLGDAVAEFRARSLGADDEFLRNTLGELISGARPPVTGAAEELLREVTS
ncbi:hypothetical protein BH10ACT8_BH10ACT8_17020 [soil metagenome]|jgi:hypothetical protein